MDETLPAETAVSADSGSGLLGRRRLIGGLVGGTAVAWAAPQIVSAPLASAGAVSCFATGFAWSGVPGTPPFDPTTGGVPAAQTGGPYAGGGSTTVSIALTDPALILEFDEVRSAVFGGPVSQTYYQVQLAGAVGTTTDTVSITFTFSVDVTDLVIPILDIDIRASQPGGWRDEVTVSATGPGATGFTVDFIGPSVSQSGSTFTGIANAAPNTTDGNVIINFGTNQISSVTFLYGRAPTGTLLSQGIGFGDFAYCGAG